MLDFGMLPPEVNSALMYSGPGSGPLMAAAAAWDALTAQLDSFTAGYSSVITELRGQTWAGPASDAMVAAATPFVEWATGTATLTQQAASQARTAAAAYETAFVATVPPEVVAANRAQLAMLMATNFFGQNTAAIAATEAAYAVMWAQDAAAMYGYAAASAVATRLTSFREPPRTTNPLGQATQPAAAAQAAQTISAAAPQPTPSLAEAMMSGISSFNTFTGPAKFGLAEVSRTIGNAGNFGIAAQNALAELATAAPRAASAGGLPTPVVTQGTVLASAGQATPVGKLSAPASWAAAVPRPDATAPALHLSATDSRTLPNPGGMRSAVPPIGLGPGEGGGSYRRGNLVFRMRDRRFLMPRPAVGG